MNRTMAGPGYRDPDDEFEYQLSQQEEKRERPIIFSGPMVKAILDSSKTMTRRVVKKPKWSPMSEEMFLAGIELGVKTGLEFENCPYGSPGDHLWVRETWNVAPIAIHYRADNNFKSFPSEIRLLDYESTPGWRPSIFMPRWASRLTLEVTGVKVERLQDISEEDIQAEGTPEPFPPLNKWNDHVKWCSSFRTLWDSINGKKPGCSWESNPWVWVVSFNKL